MAVSLFISNPFNRSRIQVENIDLQNNLAGFKSSITDTVGIQPCKQELIYLGKCLEDDERSLKSYGIENNVTVFVFEKIDKEDEKEKEAVMTLDELQGVLGKARNPLYKQSVKWTVKNKESLKKAVKNVAALKNDRVTSALVDDPDLLQAIIDTAEAEKILSCYPTLAIVLKNIVSNAQIDSSGQQLFNEDDDESEYLGIDPAFLAQAEMLATTEEQQASTSSQLTPRQTGNQGRNQISATDLANALSFASMASGVTSPIASSSNSTNNETSSATENNEQTELALQQMRAMGITDDELSRRALTLSGGVVEAALNLIFEGTMI